MPQHRNGPATAPEIQIRLLQTPHLVQRRHPPVREGHRRPHAPHCRTHLS